MDSEGYPTWLPQRPPPPAPASTFQANRLKVRYRDEDGKPQPAATLNGTLAAIPRLIVAVLENHQQHDGTVKIPAALQPYLGGLQVAPLK